MLWLQSKFESGLPFSSVCKIPTGFEVCFFQEVRAQASQTSPPAVEPITVLLDLFEIVEWSCRGDSDKLPQLKFC